MVGSVESSFQRNWRAWAVVAVTPSSLRSSGATSGVREYQALLMAGWARSHGAGSSVQTLCDRITNAQKDEINIMHTWLRDRGQPVPEAKPVPMKMMMDGMEHEMLMPGMLSEEQMKELDASRGGDFDKLFLKYMIQHHKGALQMVTDVQNTNGAGQDELTFKLTSDVYADQSTEIDRMEKMLVMLTFGGGRAGSGPLWIRSSSSFKRFLMP